MTDNADTSYLESITPFLADPEWRIDNLYFIVDKHANKIPFKRNPSQIKFWQEMWYLNDILKDRQRGFSTLIALFILDTCFWQDNISAGIIDLTLNDAQLKLDKIKFGYDNLNPAIKALNPLVSDSKRAMEWSNGSSCYVGTSHRGGTLQLLHISEYGKIAVRHPERAREIRTGALNTIAPGCLAFTESTAEGTSGDFYDRCQRGLDLRDRGVNLTKLDSKFHFFGWWEGTENEMDPEGVHVSQEYEKYFAKIEKEIGIKLNGRKRAWYVKKRDEQGDDMQREYPSTPQEAFEASIEGVYLASILKKMKQKGQFVVLPPDPGIPVNTGWDFGLSDHMTIWLHQRVGFQERLIGYLSGADEDVFYYWRELQLLGHIYGHHFLPHDGNTRRIGTAKGPEDKPKRLKELLAESGMRNIKIVPRVQDKWTAIQEVKRWLPQAFVNPVECKEGVKCLENFRREWDDNNGKFKDYPRHDWAMHGYDGLETLVRGLNAHGVIEQQTTARPVNAVLHAMRDPAVGY